MNLSKLLRFMYVLIYSRERVLNTCLHILLNTSCRVNTKLDTSKNAFRGPSNMGPLNILKRKDLTHSNTCTDLTDMSLIEYHQHLSKDSDV